MVARVLDGKLLAAFFERRIAVRLTRFREQQKVSLSPGLGVILVGDNPASHTYVKNKCKAAARCGIESFDSKLPADASFQQVADAIHRFNEDKRIHGILLQLPLPRHLESDRLVEMISPTKDSDGLHSVNQGKLMKGQVGVRPCTPLGCLRLIDVALSGIDLTHDFAGDVPLVSLAGKNAVVLGRSILVGKPVALMLAERDATVTIAHSKTTYIEEVTRRADIIIAAVGRAEMVRGEWIKPGAIVIDVGINRTASGSLVGDVAYAEAVAVAGAITPVPGGVGPMTIAMLMHNTIDNYETFIESL